MSPGRAARPGRGSRQGDVGAADGAGPATGAGPTDGSAAGAEPTDGNVAGPSSPVLELAGLTKSYPDAPQDAVRDVDLRVARGELVAVVGESGCGKTTLLRLIAGLEVPDAGVVRLEGQPVAGSRAWVPPERRGVGMVFQDYALFPHLRVRGNVGYGLSGLRRRERRERIAALLELVGLAGCGGRYPHQLSGGQQQRIALARALAPEPKLILLDEPFSSLDAALKHSVRDEVIEILRRTGTTALLVVHDSDDVMALADRVAVMRGGRVLQMGAPDGVYRRPRDEYVARFFGETNVVSGECVKGGFQTPLGFVPSRATNGAAGRVTLSIRPEHLELDRESGRGRAAVVRRVRHHGVHQRVVLSLHGAPSGDGLLRVHAPPERTFAEGDIVYVRVRADAVQILAAPTQPE